MIIKIFQISLVWSELITGQVDITCFFSLGGKEGKWEREGKSEGGEEINEGMWAGVGEGVEVCSE